MCRKPLFVAGAALWGRPSSFYVTCVLLRVLCESHCRIATVASSGDNVQIAWQAWHVVTCDDTPHSTIHTLHSTLYTVHSALYTPHFTLHTLHSTLYTLHFTLYTLHVTLYTPHSTLHTLHFTLYTPHSTIPTSHSTHHIPHSTLHFLHTSHFALHPLPDPTVYSALVRQQGKMHKTVQNTCFTKVFYVTAFGFVGCILFC